MSKARKRRGGKRHRRAAWRLILEPCNDMSMRVRDTRVTRTILTISTKTPVRAACDGLA